MSTAEALPRDEQSAAVAVPPAGLALLGLADAQAPGSFSGGPGTFPPRADAAMICEDPLE
jgi:hypothetical protein